MFCECTTHSECTTSAVPVLRKLPIRAPKPANQGSFTSVQRSPSISNPMVETSATLHTVSKFGVANTICCHSPFCSLCLSCRTSICCLFTRVAVGLRWNGSLWSLWWRHGILPLVYPAVCLPFFFLLVGTVSTLVYTEGRWTQEAKGRKSDNKADYSRGLALCIPHKK
jgi:hypothetical protein